MSIMKHTPTEEQWEAAIQEKVERYGKPEGIPEAEWVATFREAYTIEQYAYELNRTYTAVRIILEESMSAELVDDAMATMSKEVGDVLMDMDCQCEELRSNLEEFHELPEVWAI
jgi:hypothetical protein